MIDHQANERRTKTSATIRAEDVPDEMRGWIASVLGVALRELSEGTLLEIVLRSAENQRSARRAIASNRLLALLARMDKQTRAAQDTELEQAIDEAVRFVRSSQDS